MGLKNIVIALLPEDYRDQVLGDLEERGFRLRDIANVLPRIWASNLIRTISAPAPQIAGASDAALRSRTQQLARQGAMAFCAAYTTIWILYLPFRRGPQLTNWQLVGISVALLLCAIPHYYLSLRRSLPISTLLNRSRPQLLTGYRQQIDYQITIAKSILYGPSIIVVLWMFDWYTSRALPMGLLSALPIAIGLAALAAGRISHLRGELHSLDLAQ